MPLWAYQHCNPRARYGPRRAGNAGDMEPAGRGDGSDFYGLRLKPELLTVLRHAGIDVLAYDGALCPEVAGPLADAIGRIEAVPGLRALFRSVLGCVDDTVSEVAGNLRRVAQGCAQRPGVTLRVRTMDDQPWQT